MCNVRYGGRAATSNIIPFMANINTLPTAARSPEGAAMGQNQKTP